MTNAEPRIADNGSRYGVKRKSGKNSALITIEKAAPRAAPAETPINPGSASGFLKRPCKHAPDIDSAAPTIAAKRTLGKRILTKTSSSKAVRLPLKYFRTEKSKLPFDIPTAIVRIKTKINTLNIINCFKLIYLKNLSKTLSIIC